MRIVAGAKRVGKERRERAGARRSEQLTEDEEKEEGVEYKRQPYRVTKQGSRWSMTPRPWRAIHGSVSFVLQPPAPCAPHAPMCTQSASEVARFLPIIDSPMNFELILAR